MTVLFRADGGTKTGTGHLMRCLAMAEAVHDAGGKAVFACAELPDAIRKRISKEGCRIVDLNEKNNYMEIVRVTKDLDVSWIVLDGYLFDGAYQKALTGHGPKVLAIDDYGHAKEYSADLILNQNVYADESFYAKRSGSTALLLGTKYAQLRREFRAWRGRTRDTTDEARSILVSLGGSDPDNRTGEILEALKDVTPPIDVTVIVGGSNPHLDAIRKMTLPYPVEISVDVGDMPERMAKTDLAISGGGTTTYELCLLQVPMLTVVLADNQEPVAEGLEKAGCSVNLGRKLDFSAFSKTMTSLLNDAKRREAMSAAGKALVDGYGTDRIVMRLMDQRIRLRSAREDDAKLLFDWANDPAARAASLSSDPIPWEGHVTWFTKKLSEPSTLILIGIDKNESPVGYVRLEDKNGEDVLSIATAPDKRAQGYGKVLLRQGVSAFLRKNPDFLIHAYVKPENEASAKLFRSLGWTELPEAMNSGVRTLHFRLKASTLST